MTDIVNFATDAYYVPPVPSELEAQCNVIG